MHVKRRERQMPTDEPFGKALGDLLRERGLTATAFSAMTPYNQATISRYLSRKRGRQLNEETVKTMSDIARALELDPDYFVEVRLFKLQQLMEQGVSVGEPSLEGLKMLIEGARLRQEARTQWDSLRASKARSDSRPPGQAP
jgi:transcriptional regulator with XRE-family HTH domain